MTINVFGGGNSGGLAFPLQRSVRLRSSASAYFNRTFGTPTNASKWTKSFWVKRGTLGSVPIIAAQTVSASANYAIQFNADSTLTWQFSNTLFLTTTQVFRDPSAWYHIVMVWDAANATAANRAILYINGMQVTTFVTDNRASVSASQNAWETAGTGYISYNNGTNSFDGYLTEVNFIDGQALTPSSFGSINSTTGVWQPIKYSSTYGTNGFILDFEDNSGATATTIGKDSSGNGNNWTPNNISVTAGTTYDSMNDVPTLTSATQANYCVWNPVQKSPNTVVSDGNLRAVNSTGGYQSIVGSFGVSSGKWYWENTDVTCALGIALSTVNLSSTNDFVPNGGNAWVYVANGNKQNGGTNTAYGATYTSSDVIGVALDLDAGTVTFYKNGVSQGVAFSGLAANTYTPYAVLLNIQPNAVANFGQRPFSYTPPTGFKSLNTYNLPAPTIPNGATQFAATTYNGTGSSLAISNTVNGKSFQPDLVWVKGRSGATDHALYDSVRGTTLDLVSNSTAAETTQTTGLTAFGSGGFTVGALAKLNTNTATYVGWQWKAGGTAVTNTSGSITSSVSANPSAGFSIVTYTGTGANATVGHGLGVAPKMVIVKQRSAAGNNWVVYNSNLTSNAYYLTLNTTNAQSNAVNFWNNTSPTSNVFSIGSIADNNASSATYVAYCFSEIAGYSKFGSYTGNGSTDGPFVYLGFRPNFVMIKSSSGVANWFIWDSSRNTYNVANRYLLPNSSAVEDTTSGEFDILSNGFKLRANNQANVSSASYIYAAFAESPFNYSLAR